MSGKFTGLRARNYWFDDGENSREVLQLYAGGKHFGFIEYEVARQIVDRIHDLCDEHETRQREEVKDRGTQNHRSKSNP